jgi:hypothetical protein
MSGETGSSYWIPSPACPKAGVVIPASTSIGFNTSKALYGFGHKYYNIALGVLVLAG